MKIYQSGPMTGIYGQNKKAFRTAERALWDAGFVPVSPVRVVRKFTTWREAMKLDIKAMVDCDAVATLRGWEDSRGARIEVNLALELGLTVGTVEAWCKCAEQAAENG